MFKEIRNCIFILFFWFYRVMTQTHKSIPLKPKCPRIKPQESTVGLHHNSDRWYNPPSASAANWPIFQTVFQGKQFHDFTWYCYFANPSCKVLCNSVSLRKFKNRPHYSKFSKSGRCPIRLPIQINIYFVSIDIVMNLDLVFPEIVIHGLVFPKL